MLKEKQGSQNYAKESRENTLRKRGDEYGKSLVVTGGIKHSDLHLFAFFGVSTFLGIT